MHKLRALVVAVALSATTVSTAIVQLPYASAEGSSYPSIASGLLLDSGTAVSGGTIRVFAWPNSASLAGYAGGHQFSPLALGTTTTDSNGSFALPEDPANITSTYKESDGSVKIEVIASDSTRAMQWFYSVLYFPTPQSIDGSWRLASTTLESGTAPGPDLRLDLGAATAYDTGDDPAAWIDASGSPIGTSGRRAAAATSVSETGGHPFGACIYEPYDWHYGRNEHFSNIYSYSGAKGSVSQFDTITHSLGVAFSASGNWGDITAGGSISVTWDTNRGHSTDEHGIVDQSVWNRVNARDFSNYVSDPIFCPDVRMAVSAYNFLDYSLQRHVDHQFYPHCGTVNNSDWSTATAHEVTYGVGFDLGAIHVKAQSGYGTGTKVTFAATSFSYICGTSPGGPIQSHLVEIH